MYLQCVTRNAVNLQCKSDALANKPTCIVSEVAQEQGGDNILGDQSDTQGNLVESWDGRPSSTWSIGQVIDVDTEDGLEAATILGPSDTGDADHMRVRFADGVVDDWDIDDFRQRQQPQQQQQPISQEEQTFGGQLSTESTKWVDSQYERLLGLRSRLKLALAEPIDMLWSAYHNPDSHMMGRAEFSRFWTEVGHYPDLGYEGWVQAIDTLGGDAFRGITRGGFECLYTENGRSALQDSSSFMSVEAMQYLFKEVEGIITQLPPGQTHAQAQLVGEMSQDLQALAARNHKARAQRAKVEEILQAEASRVVAMLRTNAVDEMVAEAACERLGVLTLEQKDHSANISNAENVVACGGVETLLTAMQAHPAIAGVQEQGLWSLQALQSMGERAPETAGAAVMTSIKATGGVRTVLAAMQRHAGAAGVQFHGSMALRFMGNDPTFANEIVGAAGAHVLMAAMRRHANVITVQERAIVALHKLLRMMSGQKASRGGGLDATLITAGGADLTLAALSRFPQEARLQHFGLALLEALLTSSKGGNKKALKQLPALRSVALQASTAHEMHPRVQEYASLVLKKL